ncbi:MAG TPA: hypothetical protein P5040_00375 [Smithella sp.]|nr:hypothetical protein [Smithella sp.]HRS96607.1 hypothetical protein [Smithella sp.]
MTQNKTVAHYQDGKLLKGVTNDFFPNKDIFHLSPVNAPLGSKPIELTIRGLKALFFVKDYAGNPDYHEKKEFDPAVIAAGRKIKVLFKDGELMVGTTNGYQPSRPGFFLVPADPQSNNERCFVVTASTVDVSFL